MLYHCNVVCSDFEKSLEFYVDKLGGHASYGFGKYKNRTRKEAIEMRRDPNPDSARGKGLPEPSQYLCAMIRFGDKDEGATYIDLLQRLHPPSYGKYEGVNHIGISRISLAVDDVEQAYKDLKAKGVECITVPYSTVLEPGEPPYKVCNIKDPDGIVISLEQDTTRWF
jgi:catechol 2,3-dioxygenase-like lactoylglutathione lyase family enzyme